MAQTPTVPCDFAAAGTEGSQIPTFRDGPRGEGEVVAIDIGFPADTVASNEQIDYRWTVGRAFSAEPLQLALAGVCWRWARGSVPAFTGAGRRCADRVTRSPGPASSSPPAPGSPSSGSSTTYAPASRHRG